jgi:hypothetical protein
LDDGSLAGTFLQNGKKMGLGKNFFLSVYFPRLTFIPNKGASFLRYYSHSSVYIGKLPAYFPPFCVINMPFYIEIIVYFL